MADEVLIIKDGESHCRLADPKTGGQVLPLVELSGTGAVLSTSKMFETSAYLDLTVALKGQPVRQFFASVVDSDGKQLKIAWMHIDPGEQVRLRALIDAYKGRLPGARPGVDGTGRITQAPVVEEMPAGFGEDEVITPFAMTDVPPELPMSNPAPTVPSSSQGSARVGTRRVLKPGAIRADLVSAKVQPPPEPQVVIAATDRFTKLPSEPAGQATSPTDSVGVPKSDVKPLVGSDMVQGNGKTVVDADGKMDIGATLRNKAKTVRASELAARHDKVRVLNMGTIKSLVEEAVDSATKSFGRKLDEKERKQLLEEAEQDFQERLKAFQLEKASAEERSRQLADQLRTAQNLLESERKRTISADQFTVSAAGLDEIESTFKRLLDRSVAEGGVSADLEAQLRKVAGHVLDEERNRIREKEMGVHNDKIALLEKKIQRLAGNLEDAERQRDEARDIAQALEANTGASAADIARIKNRYKTGLDADDPKRQAKIAAMKELMEANRELRRQLGIATAAPAVVAPAAFDAVAPQPDEAGPSDQAAMDEAADGPVEPEVNPDDLPWEDTPAEPEPEVNDGDVGGVKRIRSFASFTPPPLLVAEPDADISDDDTSTEPEINPDDLPWEPPVPTVPPADEADERGVKRIRTFPTREPPPLFS